jgi:hypothetical protein
LPVRTEAGANLSRRKHVACIMHNITYHNDATDGAACNSRQAYKFNICLKVYIH